MAAQTELETLERDAYRASYSDGIVDIYVGLSMVWIGASWIWFTDMAALAGVLPAVFLAPMISARKRFVEARLGYVQWRAPRRRWERRNLLVLLAAGICLLLLGGGMYALVSTAGDGTGSLQLAPGILAWLLALLAVGLALLLDAARMLAYAAILAVMGVVVVALGSMPGWPMLATGVVATAVGLVMLYAFVRRYPVEPRE